MRTFKFITVAFILQFLIFGNIESFAQSCTSCAGTTVSGTTPSAIGTGTKATGNFAFSAGYYSEATNQATIALGYTAKANGNKSVAIGELCVSNLQGYAFGQNAKALGQQSLAIGRFVETDVNSGINSIVIGSGTDQCILKNTIPSSLMIGFNSTIPTLFVRQSTTYPASFSGIGKVGIGTIDPATTLHVNGDVTISPLTNLTGNMMLTTDATGKLMLTDKIGGGVGDNMGNHIATQDVILGNNMLVGSPKKELRYGPLGESWQEGLRFIENTSGEMTLNSFTNSSFTLSTLLGDKSDSLDGNSFYWASNTKSGGYGFGLKDDLTGGIYFDKNTPSLVMGFKGKKVGIGTNDPSFEFEVVGDVALTGGIYGQQPSDTAVNWERLQLHGSKNTNAGYIELGDGSTSWNKVKIGAPGEDGTIQLWADDKKPCVTVRSHEVVFGDPEVGNTVDIKVNGKIFATEVKVSLESWEDIVFDKAYKLMPLPELNSFIATNKHLPEIPSEKEVLENGVNVGEMNALLLKKIEELTLYVIEQQKQIDNQQNEIIAIKRNLSK
jgi:hypothetical protein